MIVSRKIAELFKNPGFVNIDYLVENKLERNPSKILNIINRDWRKWVKPLSMFDGGGDPTVTLYPTSTNKAYLNAGLGNGWNEATAAAQTVSEYAAANYVDIALEDGLNFILVSGGGPGEWGSHHYTFDLSSYVGFITKIKIYLKGKGVGAGFTDGGIWHYTDLGWVEDASDVFTTINATYSYEYLANFGDLLDAASLFHSSGTCLGAVGLNRLDMDFVKLEVSYTLPAKPKGTIALHAKLAGII